MATTTTLTGAQFDALPDEEGRGWELVDGELIDVSGATLRHQLIVQWIQIELAAYMRQNPGTCISSADVEFALSDLHRVRPDAFVLLQEKARMVNLDRVPLPFSPDIAIEVISPSERSADSQRKVHAYLHHGTHEVWQIYPETKVVMIHQPGRARTLEGDDVVETPLLPGFRLALATVFA